MCKKEPLVEGSTGTLNIHFAKNGSKRVVLYVSVGPELIHYDVNIDDAMLVRRDSVTLPASIQYAWPHASSRYIYVVSSNRASRGVAGSAGDAHHVCAFSIDPASGALQPHGEPVRLRQRPINMSTDIPSEYVLCAYSYIDTPRNDPSDVTVHRINRDGTLGDEVRQSAQLDFEIYAHQIRVAPSNTMAILVTRGHDAAGNKPEEPGALKVFKYGDGVLSNEVSVAPGGGYGFGPRHLDFHPSQPWVDVLLERQNKLCVFALDGNRLSSEPMFSKDTLAEPDNIHPPQLAGAIHVHPNGRFVYASERGTNDAGGKSVYVGGENTILVYAIDQRTGEPTLVQRVTTRGMHPRTFTIDPSGRLLIVANKSPVLVSEGNGTRTVPASLDIFRIGTDGKLDYVRQYEVDVRRGPMFWVGLLKL